MHFRALKLASTKSDNCIARCPAGKYPDKITPFLKRIRINPPVTHSNSRNVNIVIHYE